MALRDQSERIRRLVHQHEADARLQLYPSSRRLVSVLAGGGVGFQKTRGRDEGKSSGPVTRKGDS